MAAKRADREDIAQRLRAASPSAGAYLADNLLPAVRFATRRVPEAAIDTGQSKFGCSPDMPLGTAWPCLTASDGERRPLQFFAQVDLAQATAVAPGPLGLPSEGQLSFFADLDMSGNGVAGQQPDAAVVLYFPLAAPPLTRCSPRIPPLPSAALYPIGMWTWPASTPGHSDLPEHERAALDALRRELEAEVQGEVPELCDGAALHQLAGHASTPMPARADVGGNGATSEQPAQEWRILLQLHSDPSVEITWGNGGTICWSARAADVDAGVWNAARFIFQPA